MMALFCFIPWFLKHRIQNKNDVNRAISSQDVEQCHEDVTVSRHDVTVHVTMTSSFLFKSLTPIEHRIQNKNDVIRSN